MINHQLKINNKFYINKNHQKYLELNQYYLKK